MAKSKSEKPATNQVSTLSPTGQIVKMDRSMFDQAEGEVYAGLNLIKLEVGQADGPFVLTEVLEDQILNDKYTRGVDIYIGKPCDLAGAAIASASTIRMPASASFAQKCRDDAKLAIGDVFAVARDSDYTSKAGREDCKAYAVKVFKRSGAEPALVPMTREQRDQLRKNPPKKSKK